MKLLIVTQTLDQNDPVLGFFHSWVAALAKECESIKVICLQEGKHALPPNVHVFSLGKEKGAASRGRYVLRFWQLLWQLAGSYDTVLVHMNEEYVLLAGALWRLAGKRVYLWRNHHTGSLVTDLAALFCTKVFCTSKFSYTAKYKKTVLMPVGVDTVLFASVPGIVREPHSILFLARLAPSKRPDVLLGALGALHERGVTYRADIYGDALPTDAAYAARMRQQAGELGGTVAVHPGLPNTQTPPVYSAHSVFINCSKSGMLDKTIFEAAGAGCLVVASSRDLVGQVDERCLFAEGDAVSLAAQLEVLLALPLAEQEVLRAQLRTLAERNNLGALTRRLKEEMQ